MRERFERYGPIPLGSVGMLRAAAMAATPITELLQLPLGDRLALAIALWDSLDEVGRSDALPMDVKLCTELDRRWAAHLQNPTAAVPWEQVQSQLVLGSRW